MCRRLLIALVIGLVPAAVARAQGSDRTLLMPGVTYTRQIEFTPHGPVVLHVVNAPKPGGLYSLVPVLSNDAIVGGERVTSMEKRISSTATVVGVNGDFFDAHNGHPSGIVIQNGVLEHQPVAQRSSIGIGGDGAMHVDRIAFRGFWRGTAQRWPLGLNELAAQNGASLFTPAWGPQTPSTKSVEAVLRPFPAALPNTDLVGVVTQVSASSGSTAIPPDGAVLQARGSSAAQLAAQAPLGTSVTVRFTLNPSWDGIASALGGGPVIVSDGKPVFRAREGFTPSQISPRAPRTGVGQRADGRLVLVVVDGRQPGYSVGMTNFELALAMMQLGCVTASALDSGDSSTVAFDGQLLNKPSDRSGERAVAEALLVAYTGVYAAPVGAPVLSPNADGVADTQALSYKVVRPSAVQANLVGPGNVTVPIDAGQRAPGTYRFTWAGRDATGTAEPEGNWRFTVSATDDQGQTSTADRLFDLNDTVSSLTVRPTSLRLRDNRTRLVASFELAHAAQVAVTIETAGQIVVRVLARAQLDTGTHVYTWNGRDGAGRVVDGGRYQVHVSAQNDFGRVDLRSPFTSRR